MTTEVQRASLAAAQRRFYHNNKEKCQKRYRDWYSQNKEKAFEMSVNSIYKRKYGITLAQKREMVAAQDGLCKICFSPFKNARDTNIDHCHSTGVVRGILCTNCNLGIGKFGEDVELLEAAVAYLKEFV